MGNCEMPKNMTLLLAGFFLLLVLPALAQSPSVIRTMPEKGGEYCFLFPSQWMKSHREGNKNPWFSLWPFTENLPYSAMCCLPSFFREEDDDEGGLSSRIASVREGNCNLFENARLRPINRTLGLLTLGGDAPYHPTRSWRSGFNWGRCEEITIPGVLLDDVDILYLLLKNLIRDLLYKTGIIYLMSMGIVTIGSYWAGSTEKKKQQHSKSQREDFDEVTIDTNIYFTGTYIVSATFTLFALCYFYDFLAHAMTGIFCLYASISLYYCLAPFMRKFPFGDHTVHLPYFHKDLAVRTLLLVVLCTSVNATWVILRNEEWAWILQDLLGMSIGIYILRTVHMPTLKNCSLLLLAHLLCDIVCLFIGPLLTITGRSVLDVTAFGSPDSEKIPFLLKVPTLPSASILDGSSFTSVGLGDIVLPGFLVAYCHRFDVQVNSSGVYFLASILAYSYGLLVNFVAAMFLQASQSTLPYLVPCILITTLILAASRKEMIIFWKGLDSKEDSSETVLQKAIKHPNGSKNSDGQLCQQGGGKEIVNLTFHKEDLSGESVFTEESPDLTIPGEIISCIPSHEGPVGQPEASKKEEA